MKERANNFAILKCGFSLIKMDKLYNVILNLESKEVTKHSCGGEGRPDGLQRCCRQCFKLNHLIWQETAKFLTTSTIKGNPNKRNFTQDLT